MVSIQALLIWYLFIFSTVQFTSYTNAAFNDIETVTASLSVWTEDDPPETDWDRSSLSFDEDGIALNKGATCEPPKVFAEIYNSGETITFSEWAWELYKVDGMSQGVPVTVGAALDSGVVPAIAKEQIGTIQSTVSLPGNGDYRFKVRRPLDHPGENHKDEEGYSYIWSEVIKVTDCAAEEEAAEKSSEEQQQAVPAEKEQTEQQVQEETEPVQDTDSSEQGSESQKADEEKTVETSNDQTKPSTEKEPENVDDSNSDKASVNTSKEPAASKTEETEEQKGDQ